MIPLLAFATFLFLLGCIASQPAWAKATQLRVQNVDAYFDMERSHAFNPRESLEEWERRNLGRQPDYALLAGLLVGGGVAALGLVGTALLLFSFLPLVLALATRHREQATWNYLRRVPRIR